MSKEGVQPPHESEPQAEHAATPFLWQGATHTLSIAETGNTLSLQVEANAQMTVLVDFTQGQNKPRITLAPPALLPQAQPEKNTVAETQASKEKKTVTLTGFFEEEVENKAVFITDKKTRRREVQWLYKFSMVVLGDTNGGSYLLVVASLGKPAERHKALALAPFEEIEVNGYMQRRKDKQTGEETDELFAMHIKRVVPPVE